jgi:hypothetical protein
MTAVAKRVNRAGYNSYSDDELDDEEESCSVKRKWRHSSNNDIVHKKRKYRLQQTSTPQPRPHYKPHMRSPKLRSQLNQTYTIAEPPVLQSRTPLLVLSAPCNNEIEVSPDHCNLEHQYEATLPTLAEVTFRPHSPHRCSFTAVIRDGSTNQGVSFRQVVRLITSIGYSEKIDDFTIKPIEQNSCLLAGFSRYTSSQFSPSGGTVPTIEAGQIYESTLNNRP